MGDRLGVFLAGTPGGGDQQIMPGYMSEFDPVTGANKVKFSGTQEFTNLAFLGAAAGLAVGPVLLMITPGAPIILGNLTKPNLTPA
jgi:hypothetical protein